MGRTDNGYSAPPTDGIRAVGWDGAFAVPGVKDNNAVWFCFQYLMEQFDTRVEWLRPGWCWGYSFRANANNPNALSRHSGAIAVDLNAPLHPNGVATNATFSSAQRTTVNKILDEVRCTCHEDRVFRWGGDYTGTPDAMHFEINVPLVCVRRAALALKERMDKMDEQDLKQFKDAMRELLQPVKEASVRQTQKIMKMERQGAEADIRQSKMLRALVKDMNAENRAEVEAAAKELEDQGKQRLAEVEKLEREPANH